MNKYNVYDYASAEQYLNLSSRKIKDSRSLGETYLHLVRVNPHEISIIANYKRYPSRGYETPLITYRSDGTIVLNSFYPYQSNRRIIQKFIKGVVVVIRKGKAIVSLDTDGQSPEKIQKCRTCHGIGSFPQTCWGPRHCSDNDCEIRQEALFAIDEYHNGINKDRDIYELYNILGHHHDTCAHGKTTKHAIHNERYDCWRCKGQGRTDYGNKRRGRVWDWRAHPFTISKDGYYVEPGEK